MQTKSVYYGFHYVNNCNSKFLKEFLLRYAQSTLTGVDCVWVEKWNDETDILRYSVVGKQNLREVSCFMYGAVQMLLQLQGANKVNKGE